MPVLAIGGSLAATINLKNVEAPKVEPPRQLQVYSGPRVTNRVDSDQDKFSPYDYSDSRDDLRAPVLLRTESF